MFVLDEFDLFAKPVKQTVLYNLLDALQASNIQVGPLFSSNCPFQTAPYSSKPKLQHSIHIIV